MAAIEIVLNDWMFRALGEGPTGADDHPRLF